MTTIQNASSATINQLFGSMNSKRSQSALVLDVLTRAAKESPLNNGSSNSDITKLGLSASVLNLLQGTVGGDLMNMMLDDGTGKYNPVTALMQTQLTTSLLRSAMSGQYQKNYYASRDASRSPVSDMIASYNNSLNAANKPPAPKPTNVTA